MAKRRNLNGLPNILTQSYFSAMCYYDKGFMADWIILMANSKGIRDVEIDIFREEVKPIELQVLPMLYYLPKMREIIIKTLESTGFEKDFITEAVFDIYVSQKYRALRLLTCQCTIQDKEGHRYIGKIYTEDAYEIK
ncbi:hypothetical protein GXP67_24095 [Rhodocytophaga rosea]|uniref:Uncharacterized protein n=1 Tax=Rhodocytophaga rosea TaxID=2704465 RepID=A0A6C0GN95_9BACT|nr:hypothetical protein [Rhodocytophaga rosea]QHT69506.1 hypothetical protein GXP67_24095 [Rhodocytophaga rosea]